MNQRSTSPRFRSLALAAAATVALAMPAGCNILGPIFVAFSPPPTIKAEYQLDPKRPTVIFIDDRSNRLPRRVYRQVIAEEAQRVLLDEKSVESLIDFKAAVAATNADRSGEPMPIVEIGRAAKADVIIYVTIDAFTLSPDGQSYSPSAAVRAKVVDAVDEKRLWPEDPAGFPLALKPIEKNDYKPRSNADVLKAETELAKRTGTAIGQLFAKHYEQESAAEGKK